MQGYEAPPAVVSQEHCILRGAWAPLVLSRHGIPDETMYRWVLTAENTTPGLYMQAAWLLTARKPGSTLIICRLVTYQAANS